MTQREIDVDFHAQSDVVEIVVVPQHRHVGSVATPPGFFSSLGGHQSATVAVTREAYCLVAYRGKVQKVKAIMDQIVTDPQTGDLMLSLRLTQAAINDAEDWRA